MRRISSLDDIDAGLEALVSADQRLLAVRARAGDVPLRLVEPGFASLASIVVSQQVSTASAAAIFGRLSAFHDPLTPGAVLSGGEEVLRRAGLSRPKIRTVLALAQSVADGLDLAHLCGLDGEEAIARLTALPGIGPWSAQLYLLSCAGHPDVFPARDVALQAAVADGLELAARPGERELAGIAESWAPWRSVAARLFWSYYRTMRGREGAPLAANP